MRKASKTLRRYPPKARQLAEIGNKLDRESRRIHALAEVMAGWERLETANEERRVRLPGCASLPETSAHHGEHEGWEPGCRGCYHVWATTPGIPVAGPGRGACLPAGGGPGGWPAGRGRPPDQRRPRFPGSSGGTS